MWKKDSSKKCIHFRMMRLHKHFTTIMNANSFTINRFKAQANKFSGITTNAMFKIKIILIFCFYMLIIRHAMINNFSNDLDVKRSSRIVLFYLTFPNFQKKPAAFFPIIFFVSFLSFIAQERPVNHIYNSIIDALKAF